MKKSIKFSVLLLALMLSFSSCAKTKILNSKEAAEKLEEKGYVVSLSIQQGDDVKTYGITQVTVLTADFEDDYIQVYYFTKEEDTKAFYKLRERSLSSGVEVIKKNKYSIYRGTQKAVDDFLSLADS